MKKSEFRAMLDAQGISRTDGYSVEPSQIIVAWSDNPRRDYGTGTEYDAACCCGFAVDCCA